MQCQAARLILPSSSAFQVRNSGIITYLAHVGRLATSIVLEATLEAALSRASQ